MDTSPGSEELRPWFWGSWVPSVRTNEDSFIRGDPRVGLVLSFTPHTSHQLPLRTSKDKSLRGLNLDPEQEEETKTVTATV